MQDTLDYKLTWKQELSSSSMLVEPLPDRTRIYENGTLVLM